MGFFSSIFGKATPPAAPAAPAAPASPTAPATPTAPAAGAVAASAAPAVAALAPKPLAAAAGAAAEVVEFKVPANLPKLAQTQALAAGEKAVTGTEAAAQLNSLLKEQKAGEAINLLAQKLPEHDAVRWASESCATVADKLSPADKAAAESCKAWLAAPSKSGQLAAAAAATKAAHGGPGAWAAQAAAWTQPVAEAGAVAAAPSPLVGKAVAGSVMLAAALSKPGVTLPSTIPPAATAAASLAPSAAAAVAPAAAAADIPAAELCRLYKPFIEKGIAIASGT